MATDSGKPFKSIFRQVPKWQDLWFYQKTQVLYQMTYVFCERFLPNTQKEPSLLCTFVYETCRTPSPPFSTQNE